MTARRRLILALLALCLAGVAALVYWTSRPTRFASLVMDTLGRSLGLEITAGAASEYRLRGTPWLVVRDVVVREPGAATPLLLADRILVSVPWSTVRSRGQTLDLKRIELDRPRLDLPALQHWLASRPPGKERIPTLSDGLRVTDGTLAGPGWSVRGLHADVPAVEPGRPVLAQVRGRYLDPPLSAPFDLEVGLSRPARQADLTARGKLALEHGDWSLPMSINVSGGLDVGQDATRLVPASIGIAAQYRSQDQRIPFALGLHGPLRFADGTWTLSPASVVLRDDASAAGASPSPNVVPTLHARGRIAAGGSLDVQLDGAIARWPAGWPALPPPIALSDAPLPFHLGYGGAADLSGVTTLGLRRDATEFEGRFLVPAVLAWAQAAATGNPLPPLAGTLRSPRVDIAGAQLEGVEVTFEDESVEGASAPARHEPQSSAPAAPRARGNGRATP